MVPARKTKDLLLAVFGIIVAFFQGKQASSSASSSVRLLLLFVEHMVSQKAGIRTSSSCGDMTREVTWKGSLSSSKQAIVFVKLDGSSQRYSTFACSSCLQPTSLAESRLDRTGGA